MKLRERWLELVEQKNSVLCAGLDPPPFAMGRGDKGLPEGVSKKEWAFSYLEAVAPFCSAVKPNLQYWKGDGDPEILGEIYRYAGEHNLLVIEDSKLADIGPTNEAGIFSASQRADGVTLAPFAGNLEEACRQAQKLGTGIIPMCLMSNPQYQNEKMKLVSVDPGKNGAEEQFRARDVVILNSSTYVPQYLHLASRAAVHGADAVVVGAPSNTNHIIPEEVQNVEFYCGKSMLILAPGVGAQGGEAETLFEIFGENRVIVNIGRALMFPSGSYSAPAEQKEAARHYKRYLNEARRKR